MRREGYTSNGDSPVSFFGLLRGFTFWSHIHSCKQDIKKPKNISMPFVPSMNESSLGKSNKCRKKFHQSSAMKLFICCALSPSYTIK